MRDNLGLRAGAGSLASGEMAALVSFYTKAQRRTKTRGRLGVFVCWSDCKRVCEHEKGTAGVPGRAGDPEDEDARADGQTSRTRTHAPPERTVD